MLFTGKAGALHGTCMESVQPWIFSSFITGQCIEAVILGSMFFVSMSIFRFPYAMLVGVLIGFTALIPLFGGIIGCWISFFLILMVSPNAGSAVPGTFPDAFSRLREI